MRTRRSVTVRLHQFCPGGVDRCMTAFHAEGAGALPAPGTIGLRCPSGRVGLQIRPGRVRVPQGLPVLWRLGRSSDGAWLKPTRARRKTASLHHFFMQVERGSAWSHKPTRRSVRLRHLHPFFSERSVAANALGLGPRDRRCNSCRSDQFFRCVAQLAGHRPVTPGKWVQFPPT